MRLGILSDPHRKSDLQAEAIRHLLEQGAEYLLHAGDLITEENLRQLAVSGKPYAAVFGNNDAHLFPLAEQYRIGTEPYYVKLQDLKVKLMHMPYYMSPDTDLVISGHTHHFSVSAHKGTLFINPGEVCAREKPLCECALVTVTESHWEVEQFFADPATMQWQKKLHRFVRGDKV